MKPTEEEYYLSQLLELVTSGSKSIEILLDDSVFLKLLLTICRRHESRFRGLMVEAEDLRQKVCLKIWEHRYVIENNPENVPDVTGLRILLHVFTRNTCFDQLRKERKMARNGAEVDDNRFLDPGLDPELEYIVEEFEEYLKTLPTEVRQMVEYLKDGMSYRKIARKFDSNHVTVKSRLRRAISPFFDLDKVIGRRFKKRSA